MGDVTRALSQIEVGEPSLMLLSWTSTAAYLFVATACAQLTEDALRVKLTSIRYSPLAENAGIQGDVRVSVKSGVVTIVSGHRLLAPLASQNAMASGLIQSGTDVDLTYHFVLTETTTRPIVRSAKRQNLFR